MPQTQPNDGDASAGQEWLTKRIEAFWDFEALGWFFRDAPLDHKANTAWRVPRLSDEEPGQ